MHRQGFDLQLTEYDARRWCATFYTTGVEHSPTSAGRRGDRSRAEPCRRQRGKRSKPVSKPVQPSQRGTHETRRSSACASSTDANQWMFRHSSRKLPLKDSNRGVVRRLATPAEVKDDPVRVGPQIHSGADKLRAVVAVGCAAGAHAQSILTALSRGSALGNTLSE